MHKLKFETVLTPPGEAENTGDPSEPSAIIPSCGRYHPRSGSLVNEITGAGAVPFATEVVATVELSAKPYVVKSVPLIGSMVPPPPIKTMSPVSPAEFPSD